MFMPSFEITLSANNLWIRYTYDFHRSCIVIIVLSRNSLESCHAHSSSSFTDYCEYFLLANQEFAQPGECEGLNEIDQFFRCPMISKE